MEKCNISHAPSTGLSGIQFTIQCIGVIDTEGDEKYNITKIKSGHILRPPHNTRCCVYINVLVKPYYDVPISFVLLEISGSKPDLYKHYHDVIIFTFVPERSASKTDHKYAFS